VTVRLRMLISRYLNSAALRNSARVGQLRNYHG